MERPNTHYWRLFAAVIGLIAIFALIMAGLTGCTTERKVSKYLDKKKHTEYRERKAVQAFDSNELLAATYCGRKYPVKESSNTTETTNEGNSLILGTGVDIPYNCDSAIEAIKAMGGNPKVVRIKVPTYIRVDTHRIISRIERENTANLDVLTIRTQNEKAQLQSVINQLKADTAFSNMTGREWQDRAQFRGKWLWIENSFIVLLIVALIVYTVYRWRKGAAEELLSKIGRNG